MNEIQTHKTPMKRFQRDAVSNGVQIFRNCLTELGHLKGTKNYEKHRNAIIGDLGALLLEAPTGAGKTLMAGSVAEEVSRLHNTLGLPKVLWFWFAPFSGLIEQAIRTIRAEFDGLRPKRPLLDRDPLDLQSGDVFVTTWASVAVKKEESRKIRSGSETLPSIDHMIAYARAQGFAIGVVVDEAHHSLPGQSQAFTFYKKVLAPEITILATATPRDKDVETFRKTAGITNLRRDSVSREQAIGDRLIKEGVKVAIFKAPSGVEALINFKKTALEQAVATHNRIKEILASEGLSVTPLLLVQVEDGVGPVDEAVQWLKSFGFHTEGDRMVVRSHTADEPDPYFVSIAADESVEALVFKMSVATGFDAPRAFTLVSFRRNRDEDFGVQIVGRILRVDRRLQTLNIIPPALNHGYVFLSDREGQTGLSSAAQRINSVKTELASVASSFCVVCVGSDDPEAQRTLNGQTSFWTSSGRTGTADVGSEPLHDSISPREATKTPHPLENILFEEWELTPAPWKDVAAPVSSATKAGGCIYPLHASFGAPKAFQRAILSLESDDIVREVVNHFRFDADAITTATRKAAQIIMEEVEIFGGRKDRKEEINAELAQKEIDSKAQQLLFKQADAQGVIDGRELHSALQAQLKKELVRHGNSHLFDTEEKLRAGLHKILALRPEQLRRAISEAITKNVIEEEVAALPSEIVWHEPLPGSLKNLYKVYPPDLNGWEREFADYLDNDVTGTILWWHRNPPRKKFSVSLPLPGLSAAFYPDFVVGIKDRRKGNGILLVETKREINDQKGTAQVKAQARHPAYGKVMMIYWEKEREWQIVEYDEVKDSNYLDRALRPELFVTY